MILFIKFMAMWSYHSIKDFKLICQYTTEKYTQDWKP